MIRLESVSKRFGTQTILDASTIHFPQGERIALVGPNGAGKTTLLNIICRIDEYDDGSIIYPSSLKLGYLPQEPNPSPEPSVREECESGDTQIILLKNNMQKLLAEMNQDSNNSDAIHEFEKAESAYRLQGGYQLEARALSILNGLGFSKEQCEGPCENLSGGWRMRLELAKIFISNPDFLILDEPTKV